MFCLGSPITVGVIGGLGPAATVDFFDRVVKATPAQIDQDHLHLIIDSNPHVPNRNAGIAGTGPSPGPVLAGMARGLERAGADVLVMPCNAAHAFAAEIRAAVEVPLLSIIDATCELAIRRVPGLARAGILAAAGCLMAGLYQTGFAGRGVEPIAPTEAEVERFMTVLNQLKTGDAAPEVAAEMRALAQAQIARGAQVVIAGCTEIPLVLSDGDLPCPLISSTDALVQAVVAL